MKQHRLMNVLLMAAVFSASAFAQDTREDVIRVDTSLVNIPVIVSDRDNRYIPGLGKSRFRIFQDGVEQKIDVFSNDDAPMNVVLALDTSRSTQNVLGKIKKAAKTFLKSLDANDRCMIVSFDNDVQVLSQLTGDRKALEKAIDHADIGDDFGTMLQDAVYQVVNKTFRAVKGRKAVIILTDGKDAGSFETKADLYDKVIESDTVIYPIFYTTGRAARQGARQPRWPDVDIFGGRGGRRGGLGRFPRDPFPRDRGDRGTRNDARRQRVEANNRSAMAFLERLAELTGGRFFNEEKADLKDTFRQIADEMKRQYLVGFYPVDESSPGTLHKIRVQVDLDGAVVRSKGAYRTQSR